MYTPPKVPRQVRRLRWWFSPGGLPGPQTLPERCNMSDVTTTVSGELLDELASANVAFEHAPAGQVIAWALERFGGSVALACSFQDVVIVDLVRAQDPSIEVVFLDTGAHFEETWAMVELSRARYDLNLTVTKPGPEADAWPCGSARCCEFRKVAPLKKALLGRAA